MLLLHMKVMEVYICIYKKECGIPRSLHCDEIFLWAFGQENALYLSAR